MGVFFQKKKKILQGNFDRVETIIRDTRCRCCFLFGSLISHHGHMAINADGSIRAIIH